MVRNIELRVSSTYLNVLNFIIFDVALISLVYTLTADLKGRMNDRSLRDGEPHRLVITCPPVLGGGLCTTHRLRSTLLLLVRLVRLGLILASDLSIKGDTPAERFTTPSNVLTLGNVSSIKDADAFADAVVLRSTCQSNRLVDGKNVVYYGELRQAAGKPSSAIECVTDRTLLTRPPVEFTTAVVWRNVTTGQGCTSQRATDAQGFGAAQYFCPNATLVCAYEHGASHPDITSCRGVLQNEGETYFVEEGAAAPEMVPAERTHVRWVSGVDFRSRMFVDLFDFLTFDTKDMIDAAFVTALSTASSATSAPSSGPR